MVLTRAFSLTGDFLGDGVLSSTLRKDVRTTSSKARSCRNDHDKKRTLGLLGVDIPAASDALRLFWARNSSIVAKSSFVGNRFAGSSEDATTASSSSSSSSSSSDGSDSDGSDSPSSGVAEGS